MRARKILTGKIPLWRESYADRKNDRRRMNGASTDGRIRFPFADAPTCEIDVREAQRARERDRERILSQQTFQ